MQAIVRWSLRFRILVVGIAAAVMVIGVAQLRNAPVDVLPEYSPPYVEVQTEALGLSAAEVEQLVTVPSKPDAQRRGLARDDPLGVGSGPVLDRPHLRAGDRHHARPAGGAGAADTGATSCPNVAKPPQMIQPLSSAERVMMVGLASTTDVADRMSVLARWTMRPA